MIYRHIDIERDRFKLVNLGHFLPPYPNKNPKNQYFEKMKKQFWKYHHFTHVYQKPQSYEVRRYGVRGTKCFVICASFCIFIPSTTRKIK